MSQRRLRDGHAAAVANVDPGVLLSIFDRFPHGLAVVERSGRVAAMNAALRDLMGMNGDPLPATLTCCSLLGCGAQGGAAGEGCVRDRVLEHGVPVTDQPVQLAAGRGWVWLSASPLDSDRAAVLLELRRPTPVAVRDGSDPAGVHIRALGRTRLEVSGAVLSGAWLDQRPGQLLRYLIAERGRVVAVEDIAEAIWPTAGFTAVNTVRHLVHVLREHLEPGRSRGRGSLYIVSRRGGYTLCLDTVTVDADAFVTEADTALRAFAAGERAADAALEAALSGYEGDFLADEPYAPWAQTERERLRALAERLLRAMADLALARDDLGAATAYVERLADLEPFDGDVQRQLILLDLREGRLGRALRHYEAFRLRLARAFGEQPDFALEDLVHRPLVSPPLAEVGRWTREHEVRRSLG